MQFTSLILTLAAICTSATAVTVSYDNTYDQSSGSLTTVACSDGPSGLITKGYDTFGSLPHFPNIGGAAAVAGWNSAQCGSCWQLTYNGKSINLIAIDTAGVGFNIAKEAFDALADAEAEQLGSLEAYVTSVEPSACGFY